MTERLTKAIEKAIYFKKHRDMARDNQNYDQMDLDTLQILASVELIKIIYEEETGKCIVKIGNLEEVY